VQQVTRKLNTGRRIYKTGLPSQHRVPITTSITDICHILRDKYQATVPTADAGDDSPIQFYIVGHVKVGKGSPQPFYDDGDAWEEILEWVKARKHRTLNFIVRKPEEEEEPAAVPVSHILLPLPLPSDMFGL
jgi:hypothetical protein